MIKIGFIGAGYWGPNLIRDFSKIDQHLVHTVCDRVDSRLTLIKEKYPHVKVTTEYGDILKSPEIDAVVIAIEPRFHHALAMEALKTGKHLFVEKPLAVTTKECLDLINTAERNNLVLMVGHIFEYNSAVRKIREFINDGILGDIYYIHAERLDLGTVKADVNAMWNIAPHDVSILIYWLQKEPTAVSAKGYSYLQKDIEDIVGMDLEFPGGIHAKIDVSWLDPRKIRTMTIIGSKKMVVYDELSRDGKVKLRTNDLCAEGFQQRKDKYIKKTSEFTSPELKEVEPLFEECSHFIECITNGKKPLTDGRNGLRVVKVLEAAQKSLEKGGELITIESS